MHSHALLQAQAILDAVAELQRTAQALGWKVPLAGAAYIMLRLILNKGRGI